MNTRSWSEHLQKGLAEKAYPCYAAAVGRGNEIFFREFAGNRASFPEPLPLTENTLFDMASMSKLMGTTMSALRLIEKGKLHLNDKLGDFFSDCHGKESITVHHLMTHTSGIPAHFRMWQMDASPDDAAYTVLSYPLAAPTGEKVIYSCMGYILLGKLLELICGDPLDKIVKKEVLTPLGLRNTHYCPDKSLVCVTTEKAHDGDEYICGRVHDENAHFLGGVSGNAGIFSDLNDVILFSRMLSNHGEGYLERKTFDLAVSDLTLHCPDSSRGLGFQLFRSGTYPGGSNMSPGSYGHTGFTGTSVYVDKDSGVYCILLTNRVHFGRNTDSFFVYRREFYDKVYKDIKESEGAFSLM